MTSDYKAHVNLTRHSANLPVPLGQAVAELLARIHESNVWQQRLVNNWLAGYMAGERTHLDDYDRGFYDGVMSIKRVQHEAVALAELEIRRWGLGGRAHFADPRPSDYPGKGVAA